jgi:hypothetical protein
MISLDNFDETGGNPEHVLTRYTLPSPFDIVDVVREAWKHAEEPA